MTDERLPRRVGAVGVTTVALLLLLGCEQRPERSTSVADAQVPPSAGALSDPMLVVGSAEAGEAHALDRVFAAVLRADGSLAIGNSGSGEVRFFSPTGQHLFSTGGTGSGPGEFRSINWIGRMPGDSLLVWDLRGGRFTVLDPAGRYARDFRPLIRNGRVRPVGILPDGQVVVAAETGYDPRAGAGTVRDRLVLFTMTPAGAPGDSLADLPGAEWLLYEHPSSYRAVRLPFGEQAHVAVVGERVAYLSSASNELAFLDASGARVSSVALPLRSRQLPRSERDALLEAEIQDPAERAAIRRHLGSGAVAAPLATDLRGDIAGNAWVRVHGESDRGTDLWLVVPAGGGLARSIQLPAGSVPLDVRDGTVVLRTSDADGVQRVSVHRIQP